MTIITKQMIASAESFIQKCRGVTTERGLFDLYDTYTSGMFPSEKKGKKEVEMKQLNR